jgi:histidyl-tRNA synthetase
MDQSELLRPDGTRDFLPEDHKYFTFLKKVFRHEFRRNGYRRVSHPSFEKLDILQKIFPTSIGDAGIYSFTDKQGNQFWLVPNAVVGGIRTYMENGLCEQIQPIYHYFISKFFRQDKKRREFFSIGTEVIGESDPIIDAQLVYMVHHCLWKIGFAEDIVIKINSYGNEKEMAKYQEELLGFLENKKHLISFEMQERLKKNPLSFFHRQTEDEKILAATSLPIARFLKKDSKQNYELFQEYLQVLGIDFEEDHTLFFRETYYSGIVWTISLKSDWKVLCRGGRYDGVARKLWYDKDYGATGFMIDIFHVVDSLRKKDIKIKNKDRIDLYFVQLWDEAKKVVFPLSLEARRKGINTLTSLWTPSIKEQMLKAQRIGAKFVVLVGVMEARNGVFQVRNSDAGTQEQVNKEDIIDYVTQRVGKENLDFYDPAKDLTGI